MERAFLSFESYEAYNTAERRPTPNPAVISSACVRHCARPHARLWQCGAWYISYMHI